MCAKQVGSTEAVQSFKSLIDAIKRLQISRPSSKLVIKLAGVVFGVNLLSNGFIELDGKVAPVAIPPRQNSCRPDRIDEQGAMMEERIGSIRTGIQG